MKKFFHKAGWLTLLLWTFMVTIYAMVMAMNFVFALAYPVFIKVVFSSPIIATIFLTFIHLSNFLTDKLDID